MPKPIALTKPLVFLALLAPLLQLAVGAFTHQLGANPIEALIRELGDWALRLLLATLAMSPLRRLSGWAGWIRFRRMLGLYAFFYACLHLIGYVVLDQFFDWTAIGGDILKRPYITVGMLAFVLLIPLAVTSTKAMIRRLGRHWLHLHRLVYPIGVLGVLHYYMLVKADTREPLIYAAILAVLLVTRLPWSVTGARTKPAYIRAFPRKLLR